MYPQASDETGCEHGIHLGTSSLRGSAESRRKFRSGLYVCAPLPVCACEGGNMEEARVVGCLHAGTLGQSETGMPQKAAQSPLFFRLQRIGHSSLVKEATLIMPKFLP